MHITPRWIDDCLNYRLPEEVAGALLSAIQLPHDKEQDFLNKIESAIQQALIYKTTISDFPKRAEAIESVKKITKLANSLVEELNYVGPYIMGICFPKELYPNEMSHTASELLKKCDAVENLVTDNLKGVGRDSNDTPIFLCSDIGYILKKMGVQLTTSRPSAPDKGGIFWSVSKICLREIGHNVEDIRDFLKQAIIRIENNQGGVRFTK